MPDSKTPESTKRKARAAIQQIAGTFGIDVVDIIYCTVDAVNVGARTCDVTPVTGNSNTPILGVALSIDKNDGEIKAPTVGSTIGVIVSVQMDPFVFHWSDIDTITWKGGKYGGLVRVDTLITKINALENLINDLVSKYNGHVHVCALAVSGASATGSTNPIITPSIETSTINPITDRSDIENKNITHGNS